MNSLRGCHVLVVEDEYILAEELEQILDIEGAIVSGPYSSLEEAQRTSLDQIDAAVLNVRVRDGLTYPLAALLRARGIPFVFASGQDRGTEPEEWRNDVWLPKPYEARQLVNALLNLMPKLDTA